MNVYLTFDIEVWCNGWDNLDTAFASSFERYIFGRSSHGDYAMPKTLEILNRHGIKGVFFVEPLFAARFGQEPLQVIVKLIRDAGQEVQLHLHPEWTDEAVQPLIENSATKRQHLTYYSVDEQTALIAHGKRLLEACGSGTMTAFRSGSFAANRDTYEALRRNDIFLDSSLNRCNRVSGPDLRAGHKFDRPLQLSGVTVLPVTVFTDGYGKDRPAQVGACSAAEMRQALTSAHAAGHEHFVIVSHNFEMLKAGTSRPDWVVVRRFQALCQYLAAHPDRFTVRGFSAPLEPPSLEGHASPGAGLLPTTWRHLEQARRRIPL